MNEAEIFINRLRLEIPENEKNKTKDLMDNCTTLFKEFGAIPFYIDESYNNTNIITIVYFKDNSYILIALYDKNKFNFIPISQQDLENDAELCNFMNQIVKNTIEKIISDLNKDILT